MFHTILDFFQRNSEEPEDSLSLIVLAVPVQTTPVETLMRV